MWSWLPSMSDCEEHLCRLRVTKDRRDEHTHGGRARGNLHAPKCARVSSYRSHTFTHAHARTYIWRAAHLANRPHYTGGWSIDPSVEELKKSPFSSSPSRTCDMMSWSYLPALCGMTADLTRSHTTQHMSTKMSTSKWSGVKYIFKTPQWLKIELRVWLEPFKDICSHKIMESRKQTILEYQYVLLIKMVCGWLYQNKSQQNIISIMGDALRFF